MEDFQEQDDVQKEQELLQTPVIDEVRKSIIDELGLDEDLDSALIDKAVERELKSRKLLSKAIQQKREWREKATSQTEQKPVENPQPKPTETQTPDINELVDRRVTEKLEENTLTSANISDEIKTEVKNYAKANGVSISQALNSPYVKYLQQEEDKKQKIEKASLGNNHRAPVNSSDFSKAKPTDFDLTTKEGRDNYEKWREWKKSNS